MSESYEELKPGDYISRCNNMLANKMQCVKPGSFKVLDGDGKETGFQLCKRCKVLQEAGFGHSPIMPINETGTVEAQPEIGRASCRERVY
jgi:hypothetical protein